MKKYKKNSNQNISAVQINIELLRPIFYIKWGGEQVCNQGDWIVCNNDETYTINKDTFAKTYSEVSPGLYIKTGFVWAEITNHDGQITTKEGVSAFSEGDYIVYNNENGTDGYCMNSEKFELLYSLA